MPRASRNFPQVPRRPPPKPAVSPFPRLLDRLWAVQQGRCFYCDVTLEPKRSGPNHPGDAWATLDHVLPLILGGTSHRNRVWCCFGCNQTKANRPPSEDESNRCHRLYDRITIG